jgi:anti-anti-sigma regulatory factor
MLTAMTRVKLPVRMEDAGPPVWLHELEPCLAADQLAIDGGDVQHLDEAAMEALIAVLVLRQSEGRKTTWADVSTPLFHELASLHLEHLLKA